MTTGCLSGLCFYFFESQHFGSLLLVLVNKPNNNNLRERNNRVPDISTTASFSFFFPRHVQGTVNHYVFCERDCKHLCKHTLKL